MCTALFFYDVHPTLLFLLAFNREEYQERCGLGGHLSACALQTLPLQEEWRSTKGIDNLLNKSCSPQGPSSEGSTPLSPMHVHPLQAHRTGAFLARPSRPAGWEGFERRRDVAGRDQEWKGCLAHQLPRGACTGQPLPHNERGLLTDL